MSFTHHLMDTERVSRKAELMADDGLLVAWLAEDIEVGTEKVQQESLDALAKLGWGSESRDYLQNLAAGDKPNKKAAEKAHKSLVARLESQTTEGRKSLSLEESLSHHDVSVRARGLVLLAKEAKSDQMAQLAVKHAKEEKNPWLQSLALRALGRLGNSEHQEILLRVLGTARHGRLQADAVDGLAILDPATGGELAEGLLDHRDCRVRRAALRALVAVDVDKAIDILHKMLRSLKRPLREAAIWSLGAIDDERVEDLALHALEQENDRTLMEQEAAILWSRAPKSAIGAVGFLRRSMDSRVAEVTSALYDHLMKVHQPNPEEIEKLEEEYLERRRARMAKSVPEHAPPPMVEEEEGEETEPMESVQHVPKWVNVAIFTSLIIIFLTLVLSKLVGHSEPDSCLVPEGVPTAKTPQKNDNWRTLLGPGGTFSGRATVLRVISEHRQLELGGPSGVHITLHLKDLPPKWLKEGMIVQAVGASGHASPSGRLFLEQGYVERLP
mgnify:CR=1 FL=1